MCGHQNESQKHSQMLHIYEAAILHAQIENCYIFVSIYFQLVAGISDSNWIPQIRWPVCCQLVHTSMDEMLSHDQKITFTSTTVENCMALYSFSHNPFLTTHYANKITKIQKM